MPKNSLGLLNSQIAGVLRGQPRNALGGLLSPQMSQFITTMPQYPGPNVRDKRPDGSQKGVGFLGMMNRPGGGVSSEISIGGPGENYPGLENTAYPTMVPTLTPDEIAFLLSPALEKGIPPEITRKAREHALMRINLGLSPFK